MRETQHSFKKQAFVWGNGLFFRYFWKLSNWSHQPDFDVSHQPKLKTMCSRLLLLVAFLFVGATASSQEYLQMIDDGTYSVQEIIDNAEAYFENRDKGKGSGYVQFKRWEYMALRLMNEDGYLPSTTERLAELERYNAYLNETSGSRSSLNSNWVELGPDDWNSTTAWSPGVGRITGVSVDANDSDHMIVGANTGGVWRTIDGGATWTPLTDFFSNLYVYSVTIDPSTSTTYYFGSSSGLVFKSTDSGATWTQIGDVSNSLINKILVHPTDSDIIFACSQNAGLYRTANGGTSWSNVTPGDGNSYDVEFKPGDTNTVYAGGQSVHKSTDGGASFSTIGGFNGGAKMIGVSADDPDIVYVVDADGNEFGGFYKSLNSGDTYTEQGHTNRNYFGYDTAGFGSGGQAPRDMGIAVNPTDVDEVHIAGVLTWRSLDGGTNFANTSDWIPGQAAAANKGYCHADVDDIEFYGTTMYAATDGGIFKAEDTGNLNPNYYTDLTEGIGIRQWYKIGVSQTPDVVIVGGSQDNGSSFYTAANGWVDYIGADGMENFVDKDNPLRMYGMIQFGRMYRTDNGAVTLVDLPEPGQGFGEWVTPFEQDPTITDKIYCGYNIVYESLNRGVTWTAISQNFGGDLDEMKIAPSDNQVIYASNSGILYKTEDGGATSWATKTSPGGVINSMAVHPTDPNRIAVAVTAGTKVRVSTDGGDSWTTVNSGLPNFASLAVAWDDNGENGLYVGMDYGIYYIDDTYTDWQPYNTNMPNVIVNELEINYADDMVYAGTYGRGTWASPRYDTVLAVEDFLNGNNVGIFPNPATTEVNIVMNQSAEADVHVFDVTGKLVIYEANTFIESRHTVDISSLNAGIYFVRINANGSSITKKLLKQ